MKLVILHLLLFLKASVGGAAKGDEDNFGKRSEANGGLTTISKSSVACGDWTPYKDEKCFKVASRAGLQNLEDSKVICNAYGDVANEVGESVSRLLTIHSQEEQQFVERLLFLENGMTDNVWLGMKRQGSSGLFTWIYGSQSTFRNWASPSLSDSEHECVEMESGGGAVARGRWNRVTCQRKNAIVCEKRPNWTVEKLQDVFSDFKQEQERKEKEWEQKAVKSQEEINGLRQEIGILKRTPPKVPIGFIYVQFPNQEDPNTLWGEANAFKDISFAYAGHFFRVVGGNAANFGNIQSASTKRLLYVAREGGERYGSSPITVPGDGSWSGFVPTGKHEGPKYLYLHFRLSTDEIRPINQAVRIWVRVK